MDLLGGFIGGKIFEILEEELLKRAPELQDKFLEEIKQVADQLLHWLDDKLGAHE